MFTGIGEWYTVAELVISARLMIFVRHIGIPILTAAIALLMPALSQAAEHAKAGPDTKGSVLSATDVYAGPGPYPILGRVKRGDTVEIDSCDSGRNWCLIGSGKLRGWISGNAFEISTKKRK